METTEILFALFYYLHIIAEFYYSYFWFILCGIIPL